MHSHHINMQLIVDGIEERTGTQQSFRFPFFRQLHWFAAAEAVEILRRDPGQLSVHQRQGYGALFAALQSFLAASVQAPETTEPSTKKNEPPDDWDIFGKTLVSYIPVVHPQELIEELRCRILALLHVPYYDPSALLKKAQTLQRLQYVPSSGYTPLPPLFGA